MRRRRSNFLPKRRRALSTSNVLHFDLKEEKSEKVTIFRFVLSREDRRLFSRPFLRAKIINPLSVRRFVRRVFKGDFSRAKVAFISKKRFLVFNKKKKTEID